MKKIIRIFGSTECEDCLNVLKMIKNYNLPFVYVDAFEDRTQDLCDERNVDELPQLEILKDNKVIFSLVGPVEEIDFVIEVLPYFQN